MYQEIDVYEHMNEIVMGVKNGCLLTTKVGDEINTMSISWGKIGIEWNKLIFITYVRQNRHTRSMLDKAGQFTVNIPLNQSVSEIIRYCGRNSGKDTNKIKDMGLTLVAGKNIETPGIKELSLTLECKVIYKQFQDESAMTPEIKAKNYPSDVPSDFSGANKDYHFAYYGQVVGAHILLDYNTFKA